MVITNATFRVDLYVTGECYSLLSPFTIRKCCFKMMRLKGEWTSLLQWERNLIHNWICFPFEVFQRPKRERIFSVFNNEYFYAYAWDNVKRVVHPLPVCTHTPEGTSTVFTPTGSLFSQPYTYNSLYPAVCLTCFSLLFFKYKLFHPVPLAIAIFNFAMRSCNNLTI